MTARLNPYLSFADNAREAMEFYAGVLGGELTISTFGDVGQQPADGVMHSSLVFDDDQVIMAADTPQGIEWQPGFVNVTLSLSGEDVEGLRTRFAGLAEGGTVRIPLAKQVWGDEFGMLTDRFGVGWMVNIAGAAVDAEQ